MKRRIGRDLHVSGHDLPHWQIGGHAYFVTFRSTRGALPEEALRIALTHILFEHGRRCDIHIVVVMPDHAHIILQPFQKGPEEWYDLAEILKSMKGVSSNKINRLLNTKGSVWEQESFDRILRDEQERQRSGYHPLNLTSSTQRERMAQAQPPSPRQPWIPFFRAS